MKRCEDVRDELALFVDDALGEGSAQAVAAHIAACPRCAAEAADIRSLLGRVRRVREPEEREPRHWQDLARDIRLACDAEPAPRASWWRRPLLLGAAVAAAAALAALVMTGERDRPATPSVTGAATPVVPALPPPLPSGFEGEDLDDDELALGSPAAADDDLEDLDLDEEDAARLSAAL